MPISKATRTARALADCTQRLRDANNKIFELEAENEGLRASIREHRLLEVAEVTRSMTWFVTVMDVRDLLRELATIRQQIATVGSSQRSMKILDDLIRQGRRL